MVQDGAMDRVERTRWICEQAGWLGFDLCGVTSAAEPGQSPELARLPEWLRAGYAGEMDYLHDERRTDPGRALEGAKSVIMVALNYNADRPHSTDAGVYDSADGAPHGWISRYAWGDDYHKVLWAKLNALVAAMKAEWREPFGVDARADSGPVLERVAAKYAGLGWQAKNTCLISQELGSWMFLGTILTTLDLAPTVAEGDGPAPDLCGNCTLCLDACPTQAFVEPYVLDARRCISYLTLELHGSIPEEFREQMGHALIGCDICQDVCPWNRKAPVTKLAQFQPRTVEVTVATETEPAVTTELVAPELEWIASLTPTEFSRIFTRSAVKRTKWRGLVRNACVALGNSKLERGSAAHARVTALLGKLSASDEPLIAEHAQWALSRLQ
jgi:epoxyqueuosine reductase